MAQRTRQNHVVFNFTDNKDQKETSRSSILLNNTRSLQSTGLLAKSGANLTTSALTGSNLAHARRITHAEVTREAMLRLHKANEWMILHCQEVESELKGYYEMFQMNEQPMIVDSEDKGLLEANKLSITEDDVRTVTAKVKLAKATDEKQKQHLKILKQKKAKIDKELENQVIVNKILSTREEIKALKREADLKAQDLRNQEKALDSSLQNLSKADR